MEEVIIITSDNFQTEVVESPLPVLIDFYADWCRPCIALAPVIAQIAQEQKGKAKICKIDIENSPELAARFNIRNIPFIAFIKHGQKVGELIGGQAKQNILKVLDSLQE